jgi:hypothetical protein
MLENFKIFKYLIVENSFFMCGKFKIQIFKNYCQYFNPVTAPWIPQFFRIPSRDPEKIGSRKNPVPGYRISKMLITKFHTTANGLAGYARGRDLINYNFNRTKHVSV